LTSEEPDCNTTFWLEKKCHTHHVPISMRFSVVVPWSGKSIVIPLGVGSRYLGVERSSRLRELVLFVLYV
jgi:hypothetical protein